MVPYSQVLPTLHYLAISSHILSCI
uniref:Uncharacterized protein n=1 Tax=Arundo donax TaxID=35708 RepID=A0A0A8ZN27_ARUDO